MAQVDWITWKTDPSEIINPNKIVEELNEIFLNYHIYMNSVVSESIQYEIRQGGLGENSLDILGISPAYIKAKQILSQIEAIHQKMDSLKKDIFQKAEEQKQIEKKQLIESIEEKIKEEELKRDNTIALDNRMQENNSYITKQEVAEIIENTTDRIKRLQDRLEIARTL